MKIKTALTIAALTFVLGAPIALAQMQGMDMQKMMQEMMPSPNDTASTKDFKEVHMKMMKDMHMTFSGNADVDFVKGMIPHHQGAIEMAKVQLKHGKNPENRKLAETIIKDQEKEIAQMKDWLKKNEK